MNKLLSLGVFGTFGKPYGFQQYFYFDGIFNQTLDLNTNAIVIYPSTELFSVKREIYNGLNTICISKYSYANEINSSRGGTFIGACILLTEAYTSAENIYTLLTELHSDLVSSEKNIINNTIQVQQATQLEVKEPIYFESVKTQLNFLKETDYYSSSVNPNKRFIITPNSSDNKSDQIIEFIDNAIKYFNDFDTLYFTFDNDVINYVNQKGLLKAINWESFNSKKEEIINERAELKRKEEEERKNREGKNSTNKANNQKVGFEYWDDKYLKWGKDKGQVKKRIEEHNRLLDYCFELDSQKFNTTRQIIYKQSKVERHYEYDYEDTQNNNKLIISVVINILFGLFIVIYFIFFNDQKIQYVYKDSPHVEQENLNSKKEIAEHDEDAQLTPTPNSELNTNDQKIISKAGLKNKSVLEIIEIIFSKKPTDIQSHYKNQKEAYAKELVKVNSDCFEKEEGSYRCICDSLSHIPSFKKSN